MTPSDLLKDLNAADTIIDLETALALFESQYAGRCEWIPVGHKNNNSGIINVASDPGRSLVERVTNAVDAVLEREHELRHGKPECRSPREAAMAWLGVPSDGLSSLSTTQRQYLARNVVVRLTKGEGRRDGRTVEIRDAGIGIPPARMPDTILSLNESNKWQKLYLAGTFGQGGSSTFATSAYTLIASRAEGHVVGFTIVKYRDLPASQYKTGHYVYLALEGGVLEADIDVAEFPRGTQVKHFGYDLTSYSSPLGPNSLYGLLNQILFDPIIPVWLDARVHHYRRVIKGSRNALNGAVDEGDDDTNKSKLSHSVRMFYVTLGEFGQIGVEYWVLERPTKESKIPSAAFVNPRRPIVLTLNGQNQDEMTSLLIRKDSELPYLTTRLISHVDCNQLTPEAKRLLFTSTREEGRSGIVRGLIQKEVVRIFRSDDELMRLNEEARRLGAEEQDKHAVQQMRKEVARILRLQGISVSEVGRLEVGSGEPAGQVPSSPKPPPGSIRPISLAEPPTFIRIIWSKDEEIPFHADQRRYLRIETDADSRYHNPNGPNSRMNFIISGDGLSLKGTTPLQGGRMRAIIEAIHQPKVGSVGTIRVELMRPGLPTLSDERAYSIIEIPPAKPSENKLTLPPFEVVPVDGPSDPRWIELQWPDDVETIASSAEMEAGKLTIYYSTVFPRFASTRSNLEKRDAPKAQSFVERYKIWLAVHAFFLYRDQQVVATKTEALERHSEPEIEMAEVREREERCRMAALAALFAAREVAQQNFQVDNAE